VVVLLVFTTVTNIGGQFLLRRRGGRSHALPDQGVLLADMEVVPT
jgi:hypothetical protein